MKRWWVFVYDAYYPAGGLGDFKGAFETKEEAMDKLNTELGDHKELVYIQDDGTPEMMDLT